MSANELYPVEPRQLRPLYQLRPAETRGRGCAERHVADGWWWLWHESFLHSHGFEVYTEDNVPQISRLRIVTLPLSGGLKEFEKTIRNILVFAKQLKDGCTKAREKRIVIKNNAGKTVQGRPRLFETPNTTFGPIARLPFSNKVDPQHGDRFDPKDCSVWAQPLATITIPLWNVEKLIDRIEASEGLSLRAPQTSGGACLCPASSSPSGRRSVALLFAQRAVDKARKELLAKKLVLSDRKAKWTIRRPRRA